MFISIVIFILKINFNDIIYENIKYMNIIFIRNIINLKLFCKFQEIFFILVTIIKKTFFVYNILVIVFFPLTTTEFKLYYLKGNV